MTATTKKPIEAIQHSLPETWTNVTPDRRVIDRLLQTTLANLEAEGVALEAAQRRQLEASFGRLRTAAEHAGISSIGLFADVLPASDTPQSEQAGGDSPVPDAGPTLLMATCNVRNTSKAELHTELPLAPEVLSAVFSLKKDPASLITDRHRTTTLEPPAIIDLPAGQALLLRELFEYKRSMVEITKLFTQTYLVPNDSQFERLTILHMSTPNLEFSKEFSGMFHAIARTLAFIREGDPSLATQPDST